MVEGSDTGYVRVIDGGLAEKFREHLPDFHWQRVETGSIGSGVPDTNYCVLTHKKLGVGAEGWIEFKITDTNLVPFRPLQPAWLERRGRAGGRVYVAVRKKHDGGPRKGPPVDEMWLLDGRMALRIKTHGLDVEEEYVLARFWGGAKGWNWDTIRRILSGDRSTL